LAADISEAVGVEAKLTRGSGGIFDVTADGAVIFSKHAEGRFPENAEIIEALRQRMG
jgi:selenoprotein W-related protein